MSTKLSTQTRVQVTVEISGSSYGEDWLIKDMVEQSSREALINLTNKLHRDDVKIIGVPKVICSSYHLGD